MPPPVVHGASEILPGAVIEAALASPSFPEVADEQTRFDACVAEAVAKVCQIGRVLQFGLSDGVDAASWLRGMAESGRASAGLVVMSNRLPGVRPRHLIRAVQAAVTAGVTYQVHRFQSGNWKYTAKSVCLGGLFDAAHVNAATTSVETLRCLDFAARCVVPGGFVLVSGYASRPPVRRAVLAHLFHSGWPHLYVQSLRGHVLMQTIGRH